MQPLFYLWAAPSSPPPKLGFIVGDRHAVFSALWALIMGLIVFIMVTRAKAGKPIPELRKIAGIEAFEEAVGRATEMGRPVHMTNYVAAVGSDTTFAYWAYLAHVARLCASYDTRLICTDANYMVNSINREIIRQSYLEAGRIASFNPDDVRFLSDSQFSWTMAAIGIIAREKPGAQFMVGGFAGESLILAEAGNLVGAFQISAQTNTSQTPFLIAACDYNLIGEELYAGAAYLSKEPMLQSSVVSQDLMRTVLLALVLAGTLLSTFSPRLNFIRTLMSF